jgi:hypothetical protein
MGVQAEGTTVTRHVTDDAQCREGVVALCKRGGGGSTRGSSRERRR